MPFHFGTMIYLLTRELYTKRDGGEEYKRRKKKQTNQKLELKKTEKTRSLIVGHYSNSNERRVREKVARSMDKEFKKFSNFSRTCQEVTALWLCYFCLI